MGTIQQNNNVIDEGKLRAEVKRFTHRRCKILTQCQFLKRRVGEGVATSLIKVSKYVWQVQNLGQA